MPPSMLQGGLGGKGKGKHRVIATGLQRFGVKVEHLGHFRYLLP